MYHFISFLILVFVLDHSGAVVSMKVGDERTISFTGDILHLHIENPKKRNKERFVICLKSYPNNIASHCPQGYASVYYWTFAGLPASKYKINRRGKLVDEGVDKIAGDVVFNADNSLTLRVVELPYGCIVKLLNAVEVIPTTTTQKTTTTVTVPTKKASNNTIFYVIGGLALSFVLIVGGMIAWICWSRKPLTKKEAKDEVIVVNGSD
uniref:Uncharacterized protein n=1 Tax=Panagrellus redivivus TaxID=6233 RepID=A0A7E4UVK6_PANRE